MTDTNTNETVWSDIFNFEKNTEIFDVQDEISLTILSKLNVDLNSVTNGLERDFSSAKAFQNYFCKIYNVVMDARSSCRGVPTN